jgi:hypothetical protein
MESKEEFKYLPIFNLNEAKYTSCYCEENVYMLCKDCFTKGLNSHISPQYNSDIFAVFITNKDKKAEIRGQKAGKGNPYYTVIWFEI